MIEQSNNIPLVSICCVTYNHASYIRECLDGFMMQKTNFTFEVLIHDDASTDGTADIIREYEVKYPNIIKPIYQIENQYSKGISPSVTFNFPRAKGKYIAMCEGDDYWTDPLKLQKQVDFLESHPDYVICSHCFIEYNLIEQCYWNPPHHSEVLTIERFVNDECWSYLRTLTIMFRRVTYTQTNYMNYNTKVDMALYYALLSKGLGFYMNESMAVYRKHIGGIWSGVNSANKWVLTLNYRYSILEFERDELSAKYMYNFLMQKESRKVQLLNIGKILKSLCIIASKLGLKYVKNVICMCLFRY